MKRTLYSIANVLLHFVHLALIGLVAVGWWFCESRLLSNLLILATLISWYGLKPVFAKDSDFGYCIITDIQWNLRRRIGLPAPKGGYVKFLTDVLLGGDVDIDVIEKATAWLFFTCVVGGVATTLFFGWC